jgi:hypothetical protein
VVTLWGVVAHFAPKGSADPAIGLPDLAIRLEQGRRDGSSEPATPGVTAIGWMCSKSLSRFGAGFFLCVAAAAGEASILLQKCNATVTKL